MTQRITDKDVTPMFARAARAAKSVGIDSSNWYVRMGSRINGISYKLANFGYEGGIVHLGMTAREAREALFNLATAWEAVQEYGNK